ncbi:hypothetical protein [Pseudoxanthobacter sp.]|uniref:hypothetical protein n=1 Tax=Pseudoxanthobacter sp. TaxID=1925742 RepID=UPI002FDFB52A
MTQRLAGAVRFVLEEARHALPATAFFAIGFCFILATQKLLLREDLLFAVSYLAAIMAALVVGKAVLVADSMPFLRRFDNAPLIQPVLFKAVIYWAFVFVARLIEAWAHHLLFERHSGSFIVNLLDTIDWHRFLFIQAWILVLFLLYTATTELNRLFGEGQFTRILFRYAPSDLQNSRRQRMRTLARLARLAASHTAAELRDPQNSAHEKVMELVESLAARDRPAVKPGR